MQVVKMSPEAPPPHELVPAAYSRRPWATAGRIGCKLSTRDAVAASHRHGAPGLWLAALLGLATLATLSPTFHAWCLLDREMVAAGEGWRLWTGHFAHFSMNHLLVDAVVFALLAVALVRSGMRVTGWQGLADTRPSEDDTHHPRSHPWNEREGRREVVRDIVASSKLPSPQPSPQPSPHSCLAGRGGSVAVGSWRALSLARGLFIGSALLSLSLLVVDASLACYGGLSGLNSLLLGWLAVRWFRVGGALRVLGLGLLGVAVGKFALDFGGVGAPAVDFGDPAVVPSQLSHWLGLGWGIVVGRACPRSAGLRPAATSE